MKQKYRLKSKISICLLEREKYQITFGRSQRWSRSKKHYHQFPFQDKRCWKNIWDNKASVWWIRSNCEKKKVYSQWLRLARVGFTRRIISLVKRVWTTWTTPLSMTAGSQERPSNAFRRKTIEERFQLVIWRTPKPSL